MKERKLDFQQSAFLWLLFSAALSVALWFIPYGNYVLYPFSILSTWFHEMGHGLTALALGGKFLKLEMFSNGNGLATHTQAAFGALGAAMVAAGGLLGPAIAGGIFILAGKSPKWGKVALYILCAMLILSALIWVSTAFGLAYVLSAGAVIFLLATKGSPGVIQFAVQFLGVQACISAYQQKGYLFTEKVVIDGQDMFSDTGAIANALLLPYWFWGGLIAVLSVLILLLSLRKAYS